MSKEAILFHAEVLLPLVFYNLAPVKGLCQRELFLSQKMQLLGCLEHLVCSPGFSCVTYLWPSVIHLHNVILVASLEHPQVN